MKENELYNQVSKNCLLVESSHLSYGTRDDEAPRPDIFILCGNDKDNFIKDLSNIFKIDEDEELEKEGYDDWDDYYEESVNEVWGKYREISEKSLQLPKQGWYSVYTEFEHTFETNELEGIVNEEWGDY